MADHIIFEDIDNICVVTFNRANVLNVISNPTAQALLDHMIHIQRNKSAIILKGTGHNFSAGGDLKLVFSSDYKGPKPAYKVINWMRSSPIPIISLMEGIGMGAGLAIALGGEYCVVTEDSVAAMPEVGVGMLPDVGGSYFLSRLKHNLGVYMGLTGSRIKGRDIQRSGLATHFVWKRNLNRLEADILCCKNRKEIAAAINKYSDNDEELPLAADIKDLEYSFGCDNVEEIIERLKSVDSEWSLRTLETMKNVCPASMKIALKSISRGREMDFQSCLYMDYTLVYWSIHNHDFKEGVRALLLDKDRKPRWNPASLSLVSQEYVDSFFKQIPDREFHLNLDTAAKL